MNVKSKLSSLSGGVRYKTLPMVSRFPIRRPATITIEVSGNVVHFPLRNGRQVIGGAPECDIIALGVSPQPAFAVEVEQSETGNKARIEVLREGIRLGAKHMSLGDVVPLLPGTAIFVENVICRVSGVRGSSAKWQRRHLAAACLLASSAIAFALGLGSFSSSASSNITSPSSFSSDAKTPGSILINELREALRMSGLSLDVQFDTAGLGIDVGQIGQPLTLSDKSKLVNLVEAFSRRSEVPLRDRTRLSSGVESFIASVALEPVKFVIGVDGQRYREGDAIAGEWKIESIAAKSIIVARGEQKDQLILDTLSQLLPLRLASKDEVLSK